MKVLTKFAFAVFPVVFASITKLEYNSLRENSVHVKVRKLLLAGFSL
jgi:hypothetical protein